MNTWPHAEHRNFSSAYRTADSNVATVSLNVSSVNDTPTAAADAYSIAEDQTLTVAAGVLGPSHILGSGYRDDPLEGPSVSEFD